MATPKTEPVKLRLEDAKEGDAAGPEIVVREASLAN